MPPCGKLHPQDTEKALLDLVTRQLEKADPNATAKDLRRYGTLGVLRHPIKDRGVTLRMCQFKPDHALNPETLAAYAANRLRVVPELKYSPHAKYPSKGRTSETSGKDWRIDLVFFVNGIPVATMELKSEFKQWAGRAVHQYRKDRLPKDPATGKAEPLLTFKRGALVHFAASQYEVAMCTRLEGMDSVFLPFNQGTKDGASGNDVPADGSHPTSYLWREVLQRDTLLKILCRFVHLQVEEKEDWQGRKFKKETLIFPRYHQWNLVTLLVDTVSLEGPGHCYLVQHSAGIYQWSEVEQFSKVYFDKKKSDQALSSICKPARDRWRERYRQASRDLKQAGDLVKRARKSGDAVLVANAESEQRDAKGRKDALDLFKKDLGTFARFYEFMSQIVDFDDKDLEKLNLYARHLNPLLREEQEEDDTPDLTNVHLTHYRLQKQRQQDLQLNDAKGDELLHPGGEFGTGQAREKQLEPLSLIITRMNDLFAAENLSDGDMVSYATTIAAKIQENAGVMAQVRNNSADQAMLGDFPKAVEEAVLASGDAHHELMAQFLSSKSVQTGFARLLLEMLGKSA